MALRVWLPLNGTLENKGISDVTVTNHGAIVDTNGKIGKCYKNTGTTYCIVPIDIKVNSPFSLCFWYRIDTWVSWGTAITLNSTDKEDYIGVCPHSNGTQIGTNWYEMRSGTNTAIFDSYHSNTITTATWNHIAITFNGSTKIKTYINGILVSDGTVKTTPLSNFNQLTLFKRGITSVYGKNSLNDVRVYDHCLSPKEVKEISQGLVLHYKLDGLSQGSGNNLVTGLTKGGQTTVVDDTIVTSGQNSDTYFKINLSSALTLNKSYTMGIDAENLPEGGYFRFPIGSQSNSSAGYINIYNGHNEAVFIANDVIVNCGTSLMMDDITRTAWPNQCIFKNFYIYENTSVADSSGYKHNGSLYSYDLAGTIETTTDTPRFLKSTHIISENNTTNTASGTVYIYGNCELTTPQNMSVAFWCKPIAGYGGGTTQGQFCTTNYVFGDNNAGSDYQDSAMNHRDGTIDINDSASTSQCRVPISFTANEWHHYVITYDGQTGKAYRDGTQIGTASFSSAKTLDSFIGVIIGFSKAGGVWRSNNSYYSDFRIYATALSAEDILDLYHTSTSIDNSKKLHTFELEEISENILSSSAFEQGGLVDANGTDTELTTRLRTFYIPVMPNTSYEIFTNVNFQVRGVHFFTENQTWISFASFFAQTGQFTTPSNCYYIRIPFQKANSDANITLADLSSMGPTLTAMIERTNGLSNKAYNINIFNNGITRANYFSISQKSSIDKSGIIEAADFIEK